MADPDLATRSRAELTRALSDLERTLVVVQATIDHLPSDAIDGVRLGQLSQLEATRARLQHELASHRGPWPTGSSPLATLPIAVPLVLFLPASVAVDDEARAIERALQATNQLALWSLADAQPAALLRMFAGEHQRVLHMSGRGRDGTIVLHGDDGLATPVSSGPLTNIVHELGAELRLVVLHARASRELAQALAATVPCVIVLDGAVGAITARLFFEAFYRAIGTGASVREAFDRGCGALAMVEIPSARMPILECRADVDARHVTLIDP